MTNKKVYRTNTIRQYVLPCSSAWSCSYSLAACLVILSLYFTLLHYLVRFLLFVFPIAAADQQKFFFTRTTCLGLKSRSPQISRSLLFRARFITNKKMGVTDVKVRANSARVFSCFSLVFVRSIARAWCVTERRWWILFSTSDFKVRNAHKTVDNERGNI